MQIIVLYAVYMVYYTRENEAHFDSRTRENTSV